MRYETKRGTKPCAERLQFPNMASSLHQLPRRVLVVLVRAYQRVISPHLQSGCRYVPTCSEYAVEALTRYGALKGTALSAWRLLRCHPWAAHGHDPPRWTGKRPSAESIEPEPNAVS